MTAADDQKLLRDFARHGAEEAFRALVTHHTDLVYGTSLRIVRDSAAAQEVTQNVFIALARKAVSLPAGVRVTTITIFGGTSLCAPNMGICCYSMSLLRSEPSQILTLVLHLEFDLRSFGNVFELPGDVCVEGDDLQSRDGTECRFRRGTVETEWRIGQHQLTGFNPGITYI